MIFFDTSIPARFRGKTLDDYVPESAVERKRKEDRLAFYVDNLESYIREGKGVLLTGSPGIGKTMLACIIGNAITEKLRIPVRFITFENFLQLDKRLMTLNNLIKMGETRFVEEWDQLDLLRVRIQSQDRVLILDDVGKEHVAQGSKFGRDSLDALIRDRHNRGLVTIITANTEGEDWTKNYSEAMDSYLYEACMRVELGRQKDRRPLLGGATCRKGTSRTKRRHE